jgi:hypothetical protein
MPWLQKKISFALTVRAARFDVGTAHQITAKHTKLPQNIPNGLKIFQINTKYIK